MKKMLTAGIITILSTTTAPSFAADGNFFVNADAGQSRYHVSSPFGQSYTSNIDKTDTGGALRLGYRWQSVVDFGVEAGYADLGSGKLDYSSKYSVPLKVIGHDDFKSRGPMLGGNLKYNIVDGWYASARGGWFRSKFDEKGTIFTRSCGEELCHTVNQAYNQSSTSTGEYFGLGTGYDFSPRFSLGMSYDIYHLNLNGEHSYVGMSIHSIALYSLSAEYRF